MGSQFHVSTCCDLQFFLILIFASFNKSDKPKSLAQGSTRDPRISLRHLDETLHYHRRRGRGLCGIRREYDSRAVCQRSERACIHLDGTKPQRHNGRVRSRRGRSPPTPGAGRTDAARRRRLCRGFGCDAGLPIAGTDGDRIDWIRPHHGGALTAKDVNLLLTVMNNGPREPAGSPSLVSESFVKVNKR
jgi:hypothetical protein